MKKSILMVILMAIALVFCISTVSAAVTVESTFSSSAPTFGDENQMASNPNADDVDDENIYDTGDVTLNSTAAVTITGISISPASGFSESDLSITVDDSDTALAAGVPEAVTLKARIPEDLDAVDDNLEEAAIKVGTATITFSDASTASFDVYMQRKNMLDIDDIDIIVDDDESYDEDDNIDELKAGSVIEIEVNVENTYDDDDDDVDMDVELTVEIDDDSDFDIDDGNDVDLDSEEDGTLEATVTVEDGIDDDDYEMTLFIEGDDENGAKHGAAFEIDLEVERKSHDLIIKSTSLGFSTMSCSKGQNSVYVRVSNDGKNDEDESAVYITNSDLGIDFSKEDFEIEERDDWSKTLTFEVPDSLAVGIYPIRIRVYYSGDEDDGVLADLVDIDLEIKACSTTTIPDTAPEDPVTEEVVEIPDEVLEEFGITETVDKGSFTDSTAFIVLLVVLILGAGAGVGVLVFYLLNSKAD
ncbi:hypothetical protein GOV06_02680 [Candidatus Woesearchaeota archaeon]|nr:hypothetical protein [Candidatus Woesearchaeota archaeon]